MTVVILGCGYTGKRVAHRMEERGARVIRTNRDSYRVGDPLDFVPEGALVLHSIPPMEDDDPEAIPKRLGGKPARVVYLSTTGVYGDTRDVDESTAPAPRHLKDRQRLAAEEAIAQGPWSSVILRPAAIYGPGRGIHVSLAEGKFKLVDGGENYVSRIHVDDLAAHAEAALCAPAPVSGAWPVADDYPCKSREIAEYCAQLLNVPMPGSISAAEAHLTRRADRRVDGRAIRKLLSIDLSYPSYREGIPASLKNS